MNELVVPPAPHWYKSAVVACAPDNTLVYGSKCDLVIIQQKSDEKPADVRMIPAAHSKYIVSVSLNRKWKDPHGYIASCGEDNIIRVWDLKTLEKKFSNSDHVEHKGLVIGAVFAGDDRIVSASEHGHIVVWNINTHESKPLDDLFKSKVTLTCLSSCPHAGWLLAFGLSNGAVIVADLRRNGQVLYKLRGHYQAVVSLSWCPAPVNVFPQNINNRVKNKSPDVADANKQVDEKSKAVKSNPWLNLVHADDGEGAAQDRVLQSGVSDFLKECDDLKNIILGLESKLKEVNQTVDLDTIPGKEIVVKVNSELEEKSEDLRRREEVQNRPLPKIFDGDFLDDSGLDMFPVDEKSNVIDEPKEGEADISISAVNDELNGSEKEEETLKKKREEDSLLEVKGNNLGDERAQPEGTSSTDIECRNGSEKEEENLKERCEEDSLQEVKGNNLGDESAQLEGTHSTEIDCRNGSEKEEETLKERCEEDSLKQVKDNHLGDESAQPEGSHSTEIDCCTEPLEEEPRTEYLLASSSKDRSVHIWRAGTDGRMQSFFHVSKRGNHRGRTHVATWISVCWIAPDTILTSSVTGDILAWTVPKPKESHKLHKIIHNEHTSLVFNIVTPPKTFTSYNWRDKIDTTFWTWSQDSKLINFDLAANKVRSSYSMITAAVTSFGISALDPNRLAIGIRDGNIRIWDLSLPHTNQITMQKYQHKFAQKISAIQWHPVQELMLGFGTEEGRVGFIELNSKKFTLFPHFFHGQVYKVEWGPIVGEANSLALYGLAEGKVAIFNPQKASAEPIQLELPEKMYIHKFAWKPDLKILLLNGKDGTLIVLNNDLAPITTLYSNEKGFNSIVWHPDAFTDQSDVTPCCNWFAATTAKGFLVFDCTSVKENDNFSDKVVANLEGHVRPPVALAWCPFEGNKIVSSASDGLAHVWDVTAKKAIATFVDPYFGHNPALAWSPIDPDLIIMGDKVLRIWSVSNNPPQLDEEFLSTRKRLVTKVSKTDPEPNKEQKQNIKVNITIKTKLTPKNCIVPPIYVSNDENISWQVDNMRRLLTGDKQETPTGSVDDLATLDPLQVFGSKEDVANLLTANSSQQKKEGKFKYCELISLWSGNVSEYIRNAINENRVTPAVITLAPMVSSTLWKEACLSYAKKLSETTNSDPLETAMYFLACHKVEEAINALCTNAMYKEALALAKQRLPEGSTLIKEVVEKWATHCLNTGNFENAAYCYISLKDYENAGKVLARRNQKEFLVLAEELAEKAGNKGLAESIKSKSQLPQDFTAEETLSRVEAVLKSLSAEPEKHEITDKTESQNNEEELNKVDPVEEVPVDDIKEKVK